LHGNTWTFRAIKHKFNPHRNAILWGYSFMEDKMKRMINYRFMIGILPYLLSSVFFLLSSNSMAQYSFEKTFGGAERDWGYSVQQTLDEGFIVAGQTESFGAGFADVYLLKISPEGDIVWTNTYGGIYDDAGYSVQQTFDKGFIVTGLTYSFGAAHHDVYLIKTDSIGNPLWTRTYGGDLGETGWSVQETSDKGYIIVGTTDSFGEGNTDVYLIKTDSLGNTHWTKTYGGTGSDHGKFVQETTDGGFIISGYTTSFGGFQEIYLIKTDSSGDTLWTRLYGGSHLDGSHSVRETSDGGYIIGAWTASFGAGSHDAYLVKTAFNGDIFWTRTYGGTDLDVGWSVYVTSDGGYILAGGTQSFGSGNYDVYLIKTDASGDTHWTKTFGGPANDFAFSIDQTSDGGYIITGCKNCSTPHGVDVYLIKTCPDGSVGGPCTKNCLTFDDLDQTIQDAEIDNEGVRKSLKAKANNARKQYNRGKLKTSGNVLCALLHETDAQDGKHITPESAQDIRDCVKSLAENLGIPLPCESKKRVASPFIGSFPNPFHKSTVIEYRVDTIEEYQESLPEEFKCSQTVTLRIYDLMGREIRTLVNGVQSTGNYTIDWDGKNFRSEEAPSGVYFYRLKVGEISSTKKLILFR
jgi:hypothetical protein